MNLLQYSLFVISILVVLSIVNYIINNNIKENFVNSFDDFQKTLSNFKYSKPISLVRTNNIPYLRLLQPLKDYYVQYYYIFGIPEEDNEDGNFEKLIRYNSRPNNFDNKKNNLSNKKYSLISEINISKDLKINGLLNSNYIQYLKGINIELVSKNWIGSINVESSKYIKLDNFESIELNWKDLIIPALEKNNQNKSYCYFDKSNFYNQNCIKGPLKKKNYYYRGGNKSPKPSNYDDCTSTHNKLFQKCGQDSEIRMNYLNFGTKGMNIESNVLP
jgi:hypothetical protein